MLILPQMESKVIVDALDRVMERFYCQRTSIVCIMEQSTLTTNNGLKPIDVAGELIRTENNRTLMTYVIENRVALKRTAYQRFYNIFIIDGYESFK